MKNSKKIKKLQEEVAHWKANHRYQVGIKQKQSKFIGLLIKMESNEDIRTLLKNTNLFLR